MSLESIQNKIQASRAVHGREMNIIIGLEELHAALRECPPVSGAVALSGEGNQDNQIFGLVIMRSGPDVLLWACCEHCGRRNTYKRSGLHFCSFCSAPQGGEFRT